MKKLRKYRDLFLGIIIGAAVISTIPAVYAGKGSLSQVAPFTTDSLWLLKQARIIVEAYQVDAASKDVSETEMVHGAMRGMLSAWKDPYTRFLDPQQLEDEKTTFEGSFGGLGINITSRDGKILVINPIEGTPADKAGLRPLDEIVRVNDDIVIGWDLDKVVKKLRGDPGTTVTIGIRRKNENNLLDFTIVRDVIKIDTVSSKMLSDNVGYIRLRQFIKTSAADIGKAVIDLKNKKARGLILDLRNNGGGLLDAARDICDLFIDGGLIVSTRGRVDSANEEYYAREGVLTDLPLVVLINEGSASASEIVSGALRDRNKTLLIGAKSFGKGSVQVLFNLSDGSGMFVTTARYFTPSGVRIDHVGLTPDILVKSAWDEEKSDSEKDAPAKDRKNASDRATDTWKKAASDNPKAVPEDRQLERARQTVLRLAAGQAPETLKDPVPPASEDAASKISARDEKENGSAALQKPVTSSDVNIPSSDTKQK